MRKIALWLSAARPKTLPAAVVPVIVGTACARAAAAIAWGPALAALGGSIAIQIATNFANDVFDAEKGADTHDRIGPLRAVSAGLISAAAMKRAMILAFAVASLFGLYLVAVAGWPIVAIGIASILSGIAYTGGPFPLGYNGLGDIFVLAFFGFVAVCGTAYVQLGHVPCLSVYAAIPVGALATAILVVNNVRDRVTDTRVGKRTLAVRFGRTAALGEYAVLLVVAYVIPVGLAITRCWYIAAPLLTLPLAWVRLRALLRATTGQEHNELLAQTGQLLALHGVLFAIGLGLSS